MAKAKTRTFESTPIDAVGHKDGRKNIPTGELVHRFTQICTDYRNTV